MEPQLLPKYITNFITIERIVWLLLCLVLYVQIYSAHSWRPASCIRIYYKLAQLAAESLKAGVPQSGMLEAGTDSQTVNYTIPCIRGVIFTSSALALQITTISLKAKTHLQYSRDAWPRVLGPFSVVWRLECSARIFMAHCGVLQDVNHCLSMVLGCNNINKPNVIDSNAHLGTRWAFIKQSTVDKKSHNLTNFPSLDEISLQKLWVNSNLWIKKNLWNIPQ